MPPPILHKIGEFFLLDLSPAPPVPTKRTLIETRNGVDGYAVWYEATRGPLYQARTVVDAPSHVWAEAFMKLAYENAVGTVVQITYAGNLYDYNYLIRDVQVSIADQVYGFGGYSETFAGTPARAIVRAQWDLLVLGG